MRKTLFPYLPADPADDPPLINPLTGLKWLGPQMRLNLNANGITTFNQLRTYFVTHTKKQNEAFLRKTLQNEYSQICDYAAIPRALAYWGRNHGYFIRSTNWFAYNSIVLYAKRNFGRAAHGRIPNLLKRKKPAEGYPRRC